jgi:hypothetical protein
MFILLIIEALALTVSFFASAAALITRRTLGESKTSALAVLSCATLIAVVCDSGLVGKFNGPHLAGVVVSYLSFAVVAMRLNNKRYA